MVSGAHKRFVVPLRCCEVACKLVEESWCCKHVRNSILFFRFSKFTWHPGDMLDIGNPGFSEMLWFQNQDHRTKITDDAKSELFFRKTIKSCFGNVFQAHSGSLRPLVAHSGELLYFKNGEILDFRCFAPKSQDFERKLCRFLYIVILFFSKWYQLPTSVF